MKSQGYKFAGVGSDRKSGNISWAGFYDGFTKIFSRPNGCPYNQHCTTKRAFIQHELETISLDLAIE